MTNKSNTGYHEVINEVKLNSLVVDQQQFDLLKNKLLFAINSARTLYYINNLEELTCTLRKRALTGLEKEESSQLIREFIETTKSCEDCSGKKLSVNVLNTIAEEIGRKWFDMARHLNVSDGTIAEIETRYHFSLKQQAYQALLVYCKEVQIEDVKTKLLDALMKCRRMDLRSKVERELCKENNTKMFK